jgi:hypothetical protein
MISRSGTIPVSYQPPSLAGPDDETVRTSAKPATSGTPSVSAERSPGTSVLVSALTPDRSGLSTSSTDGSWYYVDFDGGSGPFYPRADAAYRERQSLMLKDMVVRG